MSPQDHALDRIQCELIRAGLDRLEQGIAIFGVDLRLIQCNRRALTLLDLPESLARPGTPFEEILRFNAQRGEYGPGDAEQQVAERMAQVRRMEPHAFERIRSGGMVLEISGFPLPEGGFVSTFSDVTRRRESESALRDREEMLTGMVEGNPIATFVIDTGHRVLCWNRACATLTGWPRERMLGSSEQWRAFYSTRRPVLADLVIDRADTDTVERYYGSQRIRVSQVAAGAFEAEDFFPDAGENGRWLFFTAAPLRNATGEIFGAVETLQDVTERNRAREEIERYRERLEAEVAVRTAELASANEELSQYAYAVSHDLKAPLRAVRNYADFLREDLEDRLEDEQAGYLDGIGRALQQGEDLIEDLLNYSHVGRSAADPQDVDLGGFLRHLLEGLALDDDIEVDMAEQWPVIRADRLLLRQVFQNLITNAVKFNRSSPRCIGLEWRAAAADRIEVLVRDNGIGIAERHVEQIFRIFQRLHTRSEYPGVGIGLAIVRKALAHLGGGVRVDSRPGAGSTFIVELPTRDGATHD